MSLLFCASNANADIPNGYYDTVDDSNPASLKASLHDIIKDHTRFPYTSSSTDTWDILESADQNPDDANSIISIYKNESFVKEGGGNDFYNREHTWPKSYGFPDDGSSNYPYTDAHHLFLADSDYNSDRSNKPYDNCDSGCTEDPTDVNNGRGGAGNSNWTSGSFTDGKWETWDSRKGDVARALMYMAVRYEGSTHGVTGVAEPDLILTDDRNLIENSRTNSNESIAYMGIKSVLIEWHKSDPVDDFERRHMEAVFSHQGNRNPFIDHPEYMTCVFESICNGVQDTEAPLMPTNLASTTSVETVSLTWDANSEADLQHYNIYRSDVSASGYTKINTNAVTTTTYTDENITNIKTYYYVVTAVDTSFNESDMSIEISATPEAKPVVTPPPASSGSGGGTFGLFGMFGLMFMLSLGRKKQ